MEVKIPVTIPSVFIEAVSLLGESAFNKRKVYQLSVLLCVVSLTCLTVARNLSRAECTLSLVLMPTRLVL